MRNFNDGCEQAGSSGLRLRCKSMPHATIGQDMLQSTLPTTNAKPMLLCRSMPSNMPAKIGMDQQQLSQEIGNPQKKIRPMARGGM